MTCVLHPPEEETYTMVSNALFRARLLDLRERFGLSDTEVARRAGVPSGTTVARDLGLRAKQDGSIETHIPVELGVQYAIALGIPPVEAGV